MRITYDSKYDALYIEFAESNGEVLNQNITDDITIDLDETGKIAGLEVLSASEHIDLSKILPVEVRREKDKSTLERVG